MPTLTALDPLRRTTLLAAVLVAATLPACAGGGDAGDSATYGADFGDGDGSEARIEVDPCALLTREEISEQLFRSIHLSQREHYKTDEFDVETTEPGVGMSRMCEFRFASRDSVGGGPTWHSDFNLMVFPANAVALPEDQRKPIDGAGSDMFKEAGTAAAFYVVKGDLAVSLTRFPGQADDLEGGPDAGRVALLRQIAGRLP